MFDPQLILTPVWNTDKVIGESVLMHRTSRGCYAPLLFTPLEILDVTDLSGNTHYQRNQDWEYQDGMLHLLPGSRIDAITDDELFPQVGEEGKSFPIPGGYSLFESGSGLVTRQIQVTYTCVPGQWSGIRPQCARQQLPRTFAALTSKQPLTLLLNGDSISANAQVSGSLGIPPYQPGYGDMLVQALTAHYHCPIRFINTSVGGKETNWAIENIDANINDHHPDLLIIAFGMNDGGKTPEEFEERIRRMIYLVREKNPCCEIILVSTSLPNPILIDPRAKFWGNQEFFLERLNIIAADSAFGGGIAVADITNMHRYLLSRKRYLDLTSNNVNHPNDFFYRCYAQFLTGMLTED